LAADYGWGPYTLMWIFIIIVTISTAMFFILMATTRVKKKISFAVKRKYHIETYWAIAVAAILIWLWIMSYPWMPPVAFSQINPNEDIQIVNITAGQWFWLMERADYHKPLNPAKDPGFHEHPYVQLFADKPVKFVARSVDVNHGFGIFNGSSDGAPILLQMQVVPDLDNVFYYTFREPGTYYVRCLEYCGYAHPYMTSIVKVVPASSDSQTIPEGGNND